MSAPIHTMPEEFEKGGFTLKMHQMFSVHTMFILDLCWRKTNLPRSGKSHDYRDAIRIVFEELRFEMPASLNSSGLKRVFVKLHFCDGIGLTGEVNLCFQIS